MRERLEREKERREEREGDGVDFYGNDSRLMKHVDQGKIRKMHLYGGNLGLFNYFWSWFSSEKPSHPDSVLYYQALSEIPEDTKPVHYHPSKVHGHLILDRWIGVCSDLTPDPRPRRLGPSNTRSPAIDPRQFKARPIFHSSIHGAFVCLT